VEKHVLPAHSTSSIFSNVYIVSQKWLTQSAPFTNFLFVSNNHDKLHGTLSF